MTLIYYHSTVSNLNRAYIFDLDLLMDHETKVSMCQVVESFVVLAEEKSDSVHCHHLGYCSGTHHTPTHKLDRYPIRQLLSCSHKQGM